MWQQTVHLWTTVMMYMNLYRSIYKNSIISVTFTKSSYPAHCAFIHYVLKQYNSCFIKEALKQASKHQSCNEKCGCMLPISLCNTSLLHFWSILPTSLQHWESMSHEFGNFTCFFKNKHLLFGLALFCRIKPTFCLCICLTFYSAVLRVNHG